MSSLSAMNHAGQSAPSTQLASDPNHAVHSPTMQLMSQPPANHSVQPDPSTGPYVSVHGFGVAPGPEGYTQHVMRRYVQGPAPGGGQLMYAGEQEEASQESACGRDEPARAEEDAVSPPAGGGGGPDIYGGKRKQPDSGGSEGGGARKRRQPRASGSGVENGGDGDMGMQDLELGPNGGPKHWTEDEKTRFFTWMLTSDEHWEAFRTRMNTVFRECSNEVFPGRKSYTALKSCFHRNLEVFKQIHAFQMFSANHLRQLQAENPNAQQSSVDTILEAAKVAGLNVGTLSVKIIDRWYETGWYELFRKRYREDPKTGLPVPFYGLADPTEAGTSTGPTVLAMMGLHAHGNIDPQILAQTTSSRSPENGSAQIVAPPCPPVSSTTSTQPDPYTFVPEQRQVGRSAFSPTPFTYLRSSQAGTPRSLLSHSSAPSPTRVPPMASSRTQSDVPLFRELQSPENSAHIAQAFTQLTAATESLVSVCTSLKEFVRQQSEESKMRMELMRAEVVQRQRDEAPSGGQDETKDISIEKVTFATEILKNGPDNDDIKRAAVECLTRYLTRGL